MRIFDAIAYQTRKVKVGRVIFAGVSLLAGCSFGGLHIGQGSTAAFRYGNFCGKDWPVLTATTPEEKIQQLESIQPFDDIDVLCKRHDICYASRGFGDMACDNDLKIDVCSLRFGMDQMDCNSIAHHLFEFANANPGSSNISHKATGIILAPLNFGLEVPILIVGTINQTMFPPQRLDRRCMSGATKVGYPPNYRPLCSGIPTY